MRRRIVWLTVLIIRHLEGQVRRAQTKSHSRSGVKEVGGLKSCGHVAHHQPQEDLIESRAVVAYDRVATCESAVVIWLSG